MNDLHEYNIVSKAWTVLSFNRAVGAPSPRYNFGLAGYNGKLYAFGGFLSGMPPTGDPSHGRFFTGLRCLPSVLHAGLGPVLHCNMTYGSFSGSSRAGTYYDEFHEYDLSSGTWTDLSTPSQGSTPSPRRHHTLLASDGKLYVFGGSLGTVQPPAS